MASLHRHFRPVLLELHPGQDRLRLEAPGTGDLVGLDHEGVSGPEVKAGGFGGDVLNRQSLDLLQSHKRVVRTGIDLDDVPGLAVQVSTPAIPEDGTGRALWPGGVFRVELVVNLADK